MRPPGGDVPQPARPCAEAVIHVLGRHPLVPNEGLRGSGALVGLREPGSQPWTFLTQGLGEVCPAPPAVRTRAAGVERLQDPDGCTDEVPRGVHPIAVVGLRIMRDEVLR